MKKGTPDQRQLSISSRSAAYVSVVESAGDAVDRAVAVVLAAHVVRGSASAIARNVASWRVLDRLRVAAAAGGSIAAADDDLHEVVDDDVPQRADRVVEVAAILDAEVLRHRDLHRLDVVPVPDRLEHRVREPEVEDLLEPHLPEEVVDPEELRLVDVLVQLGGERAGRREVVPERLLDDDARVLRQAGVGEALDDRAEEERRDLEVEDGALRALDRARDPLVRGGVGEVARRGTRTGSRSGRRPPRRAARRSPRSRRARARRALATVQSSTATPTIGQSQQAALLEPVQRPEGHHLRQVARDPEDHEDVGGLLARRASGRVPASRVAVRSSSWFSSPPLRCPLRVLRREAAGEHSVEPSVAVSVIVSASLDVPTGSRSARRRSRRRSGGRARA